MLKIGLILLAISLVIPGAVAGWGATNEGGTLLHPIDTFVQARGNPAAGQIFNNTVNVANPFPYYEMEHTHLIVIITYTATIQLNSNGVWAFTFAIDGVNMPNCAFNIQTVNPGTLGGTVIEYPNQQLFCKFDLPAAQLGTVDFTGNRAVSSGSPSSITQEVISYEIKGYYHLEQDMTNELLDFMSIFAPLILFGLVIVWAEITREWPIYLVGVLLGAISVVGLWADLEGLRLALVAITAIIGARGWMEFGQIKTNEDD